MDLKVLNNFSFLTEDYKSFAQEKDQCRRCSIFDAHKQVCQSEGNAKNPIFMFIGEAPGSEEISQNRPFVGVAGQRLKAEIRKYPTVFNRKTTLLSNVLSCRPLNNEFPSSYSKNKTWEIRFGMSTKTSNHRHIVSFCYQSWLRREIEIVCPKIIVTLGAHALYSVRNQRNITDNRGSWLFIPEFNAWSFATYHPSYVLRCNNDPEKEHVVQEFESDIKTITDTYLQILEDQNLHMSKEEKNKLKVSSLLDKTTSFFDKDLHDFFFGHHN